MIAPNPLLKERNGKVRGSGRPDPSHEAGSSMTSSWCRPCPRGRVSSASRLPGLSLSVSLSLFWRGRRRPAFSFCGRTPGTGAASWETWAPALCRLLRPLCNATQLRGRANSQGGGHLVGMVYPVRETGREGGVAGPSRRYRVLVGEAGLPRARHRRGIQRMDVAQV